MAASARRRSGFTGRKGDVMLKYVLKRLGYILVTLWVIVTCTFFMMKNLPGTPFDAERFSMMTPQQQERVLEMYGLNDSLPMQYVKYIKNMLKGDLGTSFTYVNQDVSKVITGRLGPSALIGIQAVLIGLAIGLILGILAAWKHNSGIDYFTMILAVLGVSVPNFVAAALLQYYIGLKWGVLPVGFWTGWNCSVLPSIALSFSATAMVARFMRTEMLDVLNRELKYTALKQLLTTALAISVGESLLKYLPLGFNDLMYGYFRTLCVGYGIYAVANTMLLLLLYFTDYRGALAASVIFAVGTSVFTVISLFCPQVYYGFGFLAGCVLFYFIVMIRLERYTRRLPYYILSIQPVVAEDKSGVFTRIGCFMDEKLERRTNVDRN